MSRITQRLAATAALALTPGLALAADVIQGGDDADYLSGESGNDDVRGGAGSDQVFGGLGEDLVKGDDGDDTVRGGSGNDEVYGGIGTDLLRGDAGDDLLRGEVGDDTLYGDSGADLFVFENVNNGADIVRDFVDGIDKLDVPDIAYALAHMAMVGGSTVIQLNGVVGNQVTLFGVNSALITAADLV